MSDPKLNKNLSEIIIEIGDSFRNVPIYEPSQKEEERFEAYISKLRFSWKKRVRLFKIEKIKNKIT